MAPSGHHMQRLCHLIVIRNIFLECDLDVSCAGQPVTFSPVYCGLIAQSALFSILKNSYHVPFPLLVF